MRTFFTSFFQIGLVAVNTVLIQNHLLAGVFLASFTISLLWAFNVSKIAISTLNAKITYALGAGCGAVCGVLLIDLIKYLTL